MKKILSIIIILFFATTLFAAGPPSTNPPRTGLKTYTVATVPGASSHLNMAIIVTDGATDTDCETTGEGTTRNICVSDGTNWVVAGDGGAAAVVEDAAYGAGWNSDASHAPSQNAVYDTIHTYDTDDDGDIDNIDGAVGGGDITGVGPGGTGAGDALTDGYQTSGTEMFVWDGTTTDDDAELSFIVTEDPAADIGITFPTATSTLATLGLEETFSGQKTFSAATYFDELIDVDLDDTDENIDIAQTSAAGTEDTPLIKIADARTGATAGETSEATVWIDADGVYGLAIVDGAIGVEGGVFPITQDGGALGSATLQFSDLFLADAGTIALGDDGDIVITHVPDAGILMEIDDYISFGDSTVYIESDDDGYLDLDADTGIRLNTAGGVYYYDAVNNGDPVIYMGSIATEALVITGDLGAADQLLDGVSIATATTQGGADAGQITLNVDGTDITVITDGGVNPAAANTQTLGDADAEWGDIFLGDGATIELGSDQDVTITHVADAGILMELDDYISFGDSDVYIESDDDGYLDLDADTGIRLNVATTVSGVLTAIAGGANITLADGQRFHGGISMTNGADEGIVIPYCDTHAGITPLTDLPYACYDNDDNSFNIYDGGWVTIAPTGAPVSAKYLVWDALDGTLTGEMLLAESTQGIDFTGSGPGYEANGTMTISLDTTEVDATTWSDGANASNIWTFDVSGTDHTMTAGSGTMTFSGQVVASAGIDLGTSQAIVGTTGLTIGNNGQTIAINSSDWDISTAGDMTGIGSVTSDGVIVATGFTIGSAAITETELEILDGASVSTTQIDYLSSATGTTGTTNTNIVFSASPTLTGTAVVTNIDGSGTISANLFTPDAADGADIGSTSLEFSDIYVASGSIVYFGNSQDVTLSHVTGLGLDLNESFGIADDKFISFGGNLSGYDWLARYDEDTDNTLEFVHTAGADADVSWDLNDSAADSTYTITNSDGTYEANVEIEGDLSIGGVLTSSASGDSYIQLNNNAGGLAPSNYRLYFETDSVDVLSYSLNGTEKRVVNAEDDQTISGVKTLSSDLIFGEQADHASTPGAGYGYLWVKSDAPSSLYFTDDGGTDYDLTAASAGDVESVGDCASGACLDGSSDGGSYVRIYDGDSHYGEFQVPDISGNVTYTFPSATSTIATLQGSDTQVIYNDGGTAYAGDAGFVFNATTDALTLGENGQDGTLILYNETGGTDYNLTMQPGTQSASAVITFPGSTGTLATLGNAETFSGAKTFSADVTLSLADPDIAINDSDNGSGANINVSSDANDDGVLDLQVDIADTLTTLVKLDGANERVSFEPAAADQDIVLYFNGTTTQDTITYDEDNGVFTFSGNIQVPGSSISIGDTTGVSSGTVRLTNASGVYFQNAAQDDEIQALTLDVSDNVVVGDPDATLISLQAAGGIKYYIDENGADADIYIGTGDAENLHITTLVNAPGDKLLDEVRFQSNTADASADAGFLSFYVDGTHIVDIDDDGLALQSGKSLTLSFLGTIAQSANNIFNFSETTPTIELMDTTTDKGADVFIKNVANDDDDAVMTIGVDDSGGDNQTYIELDGVNEDVEIKQDVVIGDNSDNDFKITFDSDSDDFIANWDEANSELELDAPNYRLGANAQENIVLVLDSATDDLTVTWDHGNSELEFDAPGYVLGANADEDVYITFDSDSDDLTINWDEANSEVEIDAPNIRFGANADEDIVITADSDSNDGTITWNEDNATWQFSSILANTPQAKTYNADDDSETVGSDITSSIVDITTDDDATDENIDIQDGTVDGQMVTFFCVSGCDASDDAVEIDVAQDSTCTGCSSSGVYSLGATGDNVTIRWDGTNTTWYEVGYHIQ